MAIPKGFTVQCAGCDTYVELDVCGWGMTVGENEEGKGVVVELQAWAVHDSAANR